MRVWLAGGALLLALVLTAACFFTLGGGRPRFKEGSLIVCVNSGGTVDLAWPETVSPAVYQLEVRCGETQYEAYYSRPAAQVPDVPAGAELQIQVRAVADGKGILGKPKQVSSWKTLKASVRLPEGLSAPEVTSSVGSGLVSLSWTGGGGDFYEVFSVGENGSTPLSSTNETSLTLQIGGEDGLPVASGGADALRLTVRAGWREKGFILCGPASIPLAISRQDLPSGPLSLTYQEAGERMYTLEWDGTQCDYFEVQAWQKEAWQTVAQLAPEARMRYDTGRLRSGSYNRFRVAAKNEDGSEAGAEEVSFNASISTLYSTIWPIQDLPLRENPEAGDRLASVPAGTALCVLAEEGNWFRVRYQDEYGWVDSRFCMINLPEYIGDLCDYDITNSYRSLFAAHDAPIRKITNQVIAGFEDIQTADGDFLVPYLYPCSKKLLSAAQAAQADGFRLKIYEAFRPQQATRFLYDTTEPQLHSPALEVTADGRAFDPQTGREVDLATGLASSVTISQPKSSTNTLFKVMTDNGRFSLGSFLAKTISAHNRGIALDLTLEKIDSGGELEMQSAIHDLSWYAATDRNNLNAKLLAGYMTGVGMNGLSSEWWHFQDDATKAAIGLNASLYSGVSAEGWTQDDTGWRYRSADGSYVRNTTVTLNGRPYTFDANGYAAG